MAHTGPALLRSADNFAEALRFRLDPDRLIAEALRFWLDPDRLIAEAQARSGREFRGREFEPALRVLLEACEREANLSFLGRVCLRWDILRLLGNVLRVERAEDDDPAITRQGVIAPIFITGLPRSGTTFLHTLLAQDPQNGAPLVWQTMQPYPGPDDRLRDRRRQRAERELRLFRRLCPEIGGLHPLAADIPQECTEITAHVFQSLRFETVYRVPSYLEWLEARGHIAAFRFHKRFLQHLQAQQDERRWVLKSPDHVFTLAPILAVYPDARFVFVHREPAAVLASVAKLACVLRAAFSRRIDKLAIGAEVSNRWRLGADNILQAAASLPAHRVLHLRHEEVTTEPLETIARVYRHFEIPFTDVARARIAAAVAHSPRGGYDVHLHDPTEFGLDPAALKKVFAPYVRAFVAHRDSATA